MPFVDLKKGAIQPRSVQSSRPEIVIHGKSHVMRLNRAAYELLGEPLRVRLAWDREEKLLGIKATDPGDPNSFSITITKGLTPSYVISCASVIRTIGIGKESTNYLPAEMKDGYLCASPFRKAEGLFAEVFGNGDDNAEELR